MHPEQLETDAIALVRRVFEAFARRDLEAVVALTDPEVELFAPTAALANEGRCYRGHDGLARYLQDVERVWARLEVMPDKFREVGHHVVAVGRVRAEARDGYQVENPVAWVWEIRDGKLCWGCVYDNPDEPVTGAAASTPVAEGANGLAGRPANSSASPL
jgi:ketosteroid isomerase-like protein